MQSTKPYLLRAIHEWCIDQGFTPYLSVAVDTTTRVPQDFVKDDNIVLNVGLEATHQLDLGNEEITFQARFNGRVFPIFVPINRVAAIYARENGQGMSFDVTDAEVPDAAADQSVVKSSSPPAVDDKAGKPAAARSHLTRIK